MEIRVKYYFNFLNLQYSTVESIGSLSQANFLALSRMPLNVS